MPVDPQLESYLTALDRALGPVPASARAEIILEIKSHILDAQANEPARRTSALLASLGDPEAVANRYLLERGLKPARRPQGAVVKWLAIGVLGSVAMVLLAGALLLDRFLPIVSVDNDKGTVRILGGLIAIDGDDGDDSGRSGVEQAQVVDRSRTDLVRIEAASGRVAVEASPDDHLRWRCRSARAGQVAAREDGRELVLPLADSGAARCTVGVPATLRVRVVGSNGRILVTRPQSDVEVTLANGRVVLAPDPARVYAYDLRVGNGKAERFESSPAPGALKIKVSVGNGRIVRG